MKNHSCNLHVPFCSIFHSNSVVVATECDWRQVQKLMIYFIEYPDLAYALTKAWDVGADLYDPGAKERNENRHGLTDPCAASGSIRTGHAVFHQ